VEEPLLSIIIPSFNQGQFIENAILSVLKQDYRNWELIIQDGASTDQTSIVCSRYASLDSRVRFFSEPDKGFADAVNKALVNCTGVLVGIQSSDDFYATKDVFAEVVRIYCRHPSVIMIGGHAVLVDSRCRQLLVPHNQQANGFLQPETVYTLCNHFSQGGMFFSRERARHVGGLDGGVDMVADTDFWVRMAHYPPVHPNMIYRTSQVWACVTVHEGQRSGHLHRFFLGRARMAVKHLRDENIPLDKKFKYKHAVELVNAACEHYRSVGRVTTEVKELYRELTGKNLPKRSRTRDLMTRLSILAGGGRKDKHLESSLEFLGNSVGHNMKWFQES